MQWERKGRWEGEESGVVRKLEKNRAYQNSESNLTFHLRLRMIGCTCLAAISNILRASTSRSFPRVRISHTLFRSPASIEAIGIFNSQQQQHQMGPKISQPTTTPKKKKKKKSPDRRFQQRANEGKAQLTRVCSPQKHAEAFNRSYYYLKVIKNLPTFLPFFPSLLRVK